MTTIATVLYEDKMAVGSGGAFPPHDLVLAMVADLTGRTLWELRRLVSKNPRNGISKLIADLGRTSLLAGSGMLYIVVDHDRIAEHVGLPKTASEAEIGAKLLARSEAPDKLGVFFLDPNLEGLLRSIEACAPTLPAPKEKDHNSRDAYLNKAVFEVTASVRDCVKGKQPGIGALVSALSERCGGAAV